MLLQLWVQMRDDFPGGFLVINYYNLRRGSEIIPLCFTSENIILLSFIIPPITQHAQLLSQAQGRVRDRQARRDGERVGNYPAGFHREEYYPDHVNDPAYHLGCCL